jgi:hypothetical protein
VSSSPIPISRRAKIGLAVHRPHEQIRIAGVVDERSRIAVYVRIDRGAIVDVASRDRIGRPR